MYVLFNEKKEMTTLYPNGIPKGMDIKGKDIRELDAPEKLTKKEGFGQKIVFDDKKKCLVYEYFEIKEPELMNEK